MVLILATESASGQTLYKLPKTTTKIKKFSKYVHFFLN